MNTTNSDTPDLHTNKNCPLNSVPSGVPNGVPNDVSNTRLGSWAELKHLALPLRLAVFVQEQGVPEEIEQDDYDDQATHAVVLGPEREAVATGRLVLAGEGVAKIGRLAVAKSRRGQGLGKLVLQALIDQAATRGVRTVKLHAQCSAETFYQGFGFVAQNAPFMEAGIEHVLMVKET